MARILVIEDDETTLDTYGRVLEAAGHTVKLVPTARAGLDEARGHRFDLLLADLFLPDGTAIELLQALRRADVKVPVVVITGAASVEIAAEAMRQGAIDYALKPLIGDDLLAKVAWGLRYAGTRSSPPIPPEAHGHAATRWAALMVALLRAPGDVKTNAEWARLVGVSTTTLRDWCRMARTSAAQSLTLARFLRVVHRSRGHRWHPARHLAASDPRTMARLIERSGLPAEAASVTAHDLLLAQGFVNDGDALLALREALGRFDASSGVV